MAGSLQYETTAYQLGLSTPGTGDCSDAKGDAWGKMNFKNGINIGVGSIRECIDLKVASVANGVKEGNFDEIWEE